MSLLALLGCATPAQKERESALPQSVLSGTAIVYVYRPVDLGMSWKFRVYLDAKDSDSEMGFLHAGSYVFFYVRPGKHTLYSESTENWSEISFNAKEGETIFIRQNAQSIRDSVMRVNMEQIPEIEGKYKLVDCVLGVVIRDRKI